MSYSIRIFIVLLFITVSSLTEAEIVFDSSFTDSTRQLVGSDYRITEADGKVAQQNLFFSFEHFNLSKGETVTFSASNSEISNIFSRVIGSNHSIINGLVKSDANRAINFFFINPNGIRFGESAKLDINGHVYFSTANHLIFDDGVKFNSKKEKSAPLLSTANPKAFGFLSNHDVTSIEFLGTKLIDSTSPQSFSLISKNILLKNSNIIIPNGEINIWGVNTSSDIDVSVYPKNWILPEPLPEEDSITALNDTNNPGRLNVTGNIGGNIHIFGNSINLYDYRIFADIEESDPNVTPNKGQVIIQAAHSLSINDETLITATNSSNINTNNSIKLDVGKEITLSNNSHIDTGTFGNKNNKGNAGWIEINTPNLLVDKSSSIKAMTITSGNAGKININTDTITLLDSKIDVSSTRFATEEASAGILIINSKNIKLEDGGKIHVNIFNGLAETGVINITTDSLEILDVDSAIEAGAGRISTTDGISKYGEGSAGIIGVNAKNEIWISGGKINTSSFGVQEGGNIDILTPRLKLTNKGQISSNGEDLGKGGNINITADFLFFDDLFSEDNAAITANAKAQDGGFINVNTSGIYKILGNQYFTMPESEYMNIITAYTENKESINGIVKINILEETPEVQFSKEYSQPLPEETCKLSIMGNSDIQILNRFTGGQATAYPLPFSINLY